MLSTSGDLSHPQNQNEGKVLKGREFELYLKAEATNHPPTLTGLKGQGT